MTAYLLAFLASFSYVGLKALQQLNVVHNQVFQIMPTSIGMSACEFYLVGYMVAMGPSVASVLSVGTGAGLGALSAMWWHRRKRKCV